MPRESHSESRTLTLSLDDHTVELAAEALRGEADRRRRAGVALSSELIEAKRGGADIRTGAMQVVTVLAEADSLADAAERLAASWEEGKPPRTRGRAKARTETSPPAATDASSGDDEDLSDLDLDSDEELDDGDEVTTAPDGSTQIAHVDDPDVAAAREALGLDQGAPAAVAPAAPATAPTIP